MHQEIEKKKKVTRQQLKKALFIIKISMIISSNSNGSNRSND